MSDHDEFFDGQSPQAVFKHGILKRYPVVFASKAGWGGRSVMFLDGYAGRGRYRDGTAGSPVLLAETALKVRDFRQVTAIYVERNPADFDNLQQVMANLLRPQDKVLCGDLNDHLASILDAAWNSAFFVFLDPFGTALDRSHIVGSLLGRQSSAPTEVLLHISVSTVARLGGLLRRRRQDGVELSPADRKTIEHADRFLGGPWWQKHFEPIRDIHDDNRATTAALRVASEYQAGVCAETGFRAVSMQTRRHPTHLPKYVLVLFTGHQDGLWYFADAVGKAGREWQGAWRAEDSTKQRGKAEARHRDHEGLFDLDEALPEPVAFDPDGYEQLHRDEWVEIIADNIESVLETVPALSLTERLTDVYGRLLGSAGERHVRAAIKSLHNRGVIENTGVGQYFFREPVRRAVTVPPQQPPAEETGSRSARRAPGHPTSGYDHPTA